MKDLELVHRRAARCIHKLPRDMEDKTVLINVNWMPLKYFYSSRILNIAFYNIDLDHINSLVVKNTSSYSFIRSLKFLYQGQEPNRAVLHRAAIAWNSLPDTIAQLDSLLR